MVQQAVPRLSELVFDALGMLQAIARLDAAQVRHAALKAGVENFRIRLERLHVEKTIVVRRLLFRSDPEPHVVGIEAA